MKKYSLNIKTICCALLGLALHSIPAAAKENIESANTGNKNSLIIDDIACRGNEKTQCAFITKKYYQQVGDVLSSEEIADARLRLGTLLQFKAVDIYLEKGHKRGHVVVVFDVNEASHLYYELGLGYDHLKLGDFSTRDSYALTSKVTNFNFLGTGKELSLSLSGTRSNGKLDTLSTFGFEDNNGNLSILEYRNQAYEKLNNYSVGLGYYDPHLMGSSHYYVAANLRFNKYAIDERTTVIEDPFGNPTPSLARFKRDDTYYSHNFLIGRRFGSYSYISLDAVTTNTVSTDQTSYGITYGWNSEDDLLFPTKGSTFSTRASKFRDQYEIDLRFKQNVSIATGHVLSYGTNITYNQANDNCSLCPLVLDDTISASVFGRYSNIDVIDKREGTYAGWHVGFYVGQGNISEDFYNYHYSGINAGYTLQTQNMIYRFSLALNQQESK